MNIESLTERYTALPQLGRVRALARLSWKLTIIARGHYPNNDDARQSALIDINEFQHRIAQMIVDVSEGSSFRSDREVVEYLAVGLEQFGVVRILEEVL